MESKKYVVITFGSYVGIALQKSRDNYVRKLCQIYVKRIRNKTIQFRTKKYLILT